ncbi:MAG: hypothetical protein ACYS9X_05245 [Planctomycetota bacterium]|jgi:hypothetical protein
MAFDQEQLERLNSDYLKVTGKPPARFVCPITLHDDPDAVLCDGHILNQAIIQASRVSVVQRKDVDNYYGHAVEAELVAFLNTRLSSPAELLRRARDLRITAPEGETMEAFFASPKAEVKFTRIELLDKDGNTIASPFVRKYVLEDRKYEGLTIEASMSFRNACLTAGMLKSAYLAIYRMLGYRWVLNAVTNKVRRALSSFFAGETSGSPDCFEGFDGAVSALLGKEASAINDTLEADTLLFHRTKDEGLWFAVSCLFKINGCALAVTLPFYEREGYGLVALREYKRFLRNRYMPHDYFWMRFNGDAFEALSGPCQIKKPADSSG